MKPALLGHDAVTVPEAGWAGRKNGELLQLLAGRFDVLITVDRGILSQQALVDRPFAVLLLQARSNRLSDLMPLVPTILRVLPEVQPGSIVRISA